MREAGLTGSDQGLPTSVRVKHGTNGTGKKIHYYLNYSSDAATVQYAYGAGHDLLTGNALASGAAVQIAPWDLVIAEEN